MLETTVVLEGLSRRFIEGAVVLALLVINAVIGFLHEHRAEDAVEALRSRLRLQARVRRDGVWGTRDARDLIPDDVVHVRMGDVVPADLEIIAGNVLVDESVLTGESLPVERSSSGRLYSASTIKRGEATALVRSTGTHTKFGVTVELLRSADDGSHLRDRVFGIVWYLVAFDAILLIAYVAYSSLRGTQISEMLSFALTLLLGAIPIALPATFTLATALGSIQLAKRGVLVTRLSAIEDAAVMDVLCVDKTGTLTQNRLSVDSVIPFAGVGIEAVLRAAALASDAATQDPLDLAIFAECRRRDIVLQTFTSTEFQPFDPERKYAETIARDAHGRTYRAAKGSRNEIAALCGGTGIDAAMPQGLVAEGQRVLTVAAGADDGYKLLGFIAFADPLRDDAAKLIEDVRAAGVRVVMLTGDTLGTARAIAARLGLGARVVTADDVRSDLSIVERVDAVARVLPEDKFAIVRWLQQNGHACAMTGDGVNDAPALQAAQVGIAVAGATDAAKASASLVLTTPGLIEIVLGIEESRRIFHRLSIYTINKIAKTIEIGIVLTVAAFLTRTVPLTPLLMILLLFANDFATMAIAGDRVTFSRLPERWSSGKALLEGTSFAILLSAFSLTAFFVALNFARLNVSQAQAAMFLLFVCSSQGLIYLIRERCGFWRTTPAPALAVTSLSVVTISALLAVSGTLMARVPPSFAVTIVIAVALYLALIGLIRGAARSRLVR